MPYDHPLDRQGHIVSVLHSGTTAYSSCIELVSLGISITARVESRDIHLQYFDIAGTIPGQDNHNIWASLHFLPLVSNVFLPCYSSGTFLSHLAEGEYGFDIIGSNCIDMYQMYVVVPTVCCGIPHVGVGVVYQCSSLHIGDIEDCTIFLKTFFAHCESSVDMVPSQAFFLRKRRVGSLVLTLALVNLRRYCHTMSWCGGPRGIPIPSYLFYTGTDFPHDVGYQPSLRRHPGEGDGLHSTQVQGAARHQIPMESCFLQIPQ